MQVSSPRRTSGASIQLRGALLMPLAALAVHQLRYYLAFGEHASARLARDGHAYVSLLEPALVLGAALAFGGLAGRMSRAWQGQPRSDRASSPGARTWLTCALTLFALYCGQELLEGATASGHAAGVAAIFGHGGWIAAPLSCLLAVALAALLAVADALVRILGALRRPATAVPRAPAPRAFSRSDWRLDPAAGIAAGRAPPVALATA